MPAASGRETVIIDFDAAGGAASPFVEVQDSTVPGPAGILYQIVGITNVQTVWLDTGAGQDEIFIRTPVNPAGYASGVNTLVLAGGLDADRFVLDLAGRVVSSNLPSRFWEKADRTS